MNTVILKPFGAFLCMAAVCSAGTITLFNTGTDASNLALVGANGTVDPHYTVVETGQSAVTFFTAGYLSETANSRWISETADGSTPVNPATFRLSFNLTGVDPTTVTITGNWAADNCGHVLLNGTTEVGIIPVCNSATSFNTFTAFSLNSGFVSGANTLDFVLTNTGGPGAVRVDNLAGTAGAVPEPATLLLGAPALALALLSRRRRVLARVGAAAPPAASPCYPNGGELRCLLAP